VLGWRPVPGSARLPPPDETTEQRLVHVVTDEMRVPFEGGARRGGVGAFRAPAGVLVGSSPARPR